MNRKDYQQVKQIFQSALDIAPDERSDYLNEKCSDNTVIRQEVEKLLNSFESGYLEQPAVEKIAEAIIGSNLSVGQEIGHYKIVKKIGAGGMGEVYLAEDTKLKRQVAIKILPVAFAEDAERMRRFVREAKSDSALNHPNIITIYEIGEADGIHFIATEYIEGETLRDYLKHEKLSVKSALEISIQIVSALQAAHGTGIIHRDIKPENVMIRPDGLVKILDFGIAKLSEPRNLLVSGLNVGEEAATAINSGTSPGMIIGTANYISPEQAQGKKVDGRSDIFSFGIVLYEMLSGKRAFEGENAMDVISSILKDEPKPLHQLLPEVPHEVERIINKTLRKNRDKRYQTARGLLTDLKDAKQELEFQDKLERTIPPHREDQKTQLMNAPTSDVPHTASSAEFITQEVKKHKLGFVAALLVLLSAAIGLGYWFFANRAANTKQIESIAVMPFVNESGNADVEYLSDGMTETLISSLSRLSNLNVKARSTVFRYKGKAADANTIGKELNVQAILNGRVVQRGDQLTLTLELVDARSENVIWSEQYNRKQTDLISLQSEIAHDVSQKLKATLSGADEQKLAKNYTENPEAYRLYLQGRFYWNKRSEENLRKAVEQFKAAAEIDPNYALAYAGLADCYAVMPQNTGNPSDETFLQAKAYANRALEIDDSLGEAPASLGQINTNSWNWAEAEKEFKRAIELNPNYPTAHHWYARFLRFMGRSDEALAEIKRANELDPLSLVILNNLVQVYFERGEIDAAFEQCRKALELDPNYSGTHTSLSEIYLKQGRNTEALAEGQKAVELSNRSNGQLSVLGYVQAVSGNRNEALAVIKEFEEKYLKSKTNSFDIAGIYAGLGNKEEAFAWLEKAFYNHSASMTALKIEPAFESFHNDPRYKDLLRRMNLPE